MDNLEDNTRFSNKERVQKAKEFLIEHPDETPKCAATIFDIPPTTLYHALEREKRRSQSKTQRHGSGGHNKIMTPYETEVLHDMIQSLIESGIEPTQQEILDAIIELKRRQGKKAPSKRWFSTWWKANSSPKPKTKTKPVDIVSTLPLPLVNPTTPLEVKAGLHGWHDIIQRCMVWSYPGEAEEFTTFIHNASKVCDKAALIDVQLSMHKKRRQEELKAKVTSRKRLQSAGSGLGLTKEQADDRERHGEGHVEGQNDEDDDGEETFFITDVVGDSAAPEDV